MVLDSSALIAILENEPQATVFATTIELNSIRLLSAVSWVETAMVIESRHGNIGQQKFDELLRKAQVEIVPVTVEQAEIARCAFRLYGKGRHPAALNFGDCFSYALAKLTGEPLLFKGNDFSQTDLKLV
jgi:ribonuclease VapC